MLVDWNSWEKMQRMPFKKLQSNRVKTDIEEAIESVRIKRVEFRKKCKDFLSP